MSVDSNKKIFYDTLPRKRSAVGVLIFDSDKLLVLEPTYKPNWVVPGGVVEKSESPYEAAIRECKEEIGLNVEIVSFLCADYKRGNDEIGDAVHFMFLAQLRKEAEITVDPNEIKGFYWMKTADAMRKFDHHLSARIAVGLRAIEQNRALYCEDGQIVI